MKCLLKYVKPDLRRFRHKHDKGIDEMVLMRMWGKYKATGGISNVRDSIKIYEINDVL